MAKKNESTYEYKEAPMRQALVYSAFGWLIGKRSQHYSRKLNKEVVTLRRDYLISTNPVIVDCEKEYAKLEKGRIPVKHRSNVFLGFIGKTLVMLFTIAVLLAGVGLTVVGLYDGFVVGKKSWAVYNAAVEAELSPDPFYIEEIGGKAELPDGYYDFVSKHPTINTFGDLVAFNDGKVDEEKLLRSYETWLTTFGVVEEGDEDGFAKVDKTVVKNADGEYPADNEFEPFGIVRGFVFGRGLGKLFASMPIWFNACTAFGAALIVVFVVTVVIEAAVGKKKKREKRIKIAQLKSECLKTASAALRQMKSENRELMTRRDMQMSDLEAMFSQVMESHSDDDD